MVVQTHRREVTAKTNFDFTGGGYRKRFITRTIRMFRHLSFMVMLLMQLENRDGAPDLGRSERREAL